MTMRLCSSTFLAVAVLASLSACPAEPPNPSDTRQPYVDDWQTEATLPAAQFRKLSIGDRIASDNFANRGDIEVRYEAGIDSITVEMQRFTVASSPEAADEAFAKMHYWGYDLSSPEQPSDDNVEDSCENPEVDTCYVRAYYDGLFQPLRDGANFRVTIPAGWDGNLELTTSDNLEEGIESYPDRSDILVDGVRGNLTVDMDSGNIQVKMDPTVDHFAGCAMNDACVMEGFAMGCGCSEPTNISIANKNGQASNMTVDVSNADHWYFLSLDNRGTFSSSDDFICTATIDCESFPDCLLEEDDLTLENKQRADINFPGEPAISGAGIRVQLISESCANIEYVEGPDDYESDDLPQEKRGDLRVCVGCLENL